MALNKRPPLVEFEIVDRDAKAFAGQPVQREQKTIRLTEGEAKFYLSNGALRRPATKQVVAAPAPAVPEAEPAPAMKADLDDEAKPAPASKASARK